MYIVLENSYLFINIMSYPCNMISLKVVFDRLTMIKDKITSWLDVLFHQF